MSRDQRVQGNEKHCWMPYGPSVAIFSKQFALPVCSDLARALTPSLSDHKCPLKFCFVSTAVLFVFLLRKTWIRLRLYRNFPFPLQTIGLCCTLRSWLWRWRSHCTFVSVSFPGFLMHLTDILLSWWKVCKKLNRFVQLPVFLRHRFQPIGHSRTRTLVFCILQECRELDINFHLLIGFSKDNVPKFVVDNKVGGVMTDFSPLRVPLSWVEDVRTGLPANVPFCQVCCLPHSARPQLQGH